MEDKLVAVSSCLFICFVLLFVCFFRFLGGGGGNWGEDTFVSGYLQISYLFH